MFKKRAGFLTRCVLAVAAFALLCSCAGSYITPNFSRPGFSLADFRAARSILVVTENAQVLAFNKSFAKAYGNGESLAKHLSRMLEDSLNASGSGMAISLGSPELSKVLDSASRDTAVKLDSVFKSIDARYVVHVGNILIRSFATYTEGVMAPSGPGGQMAMTGGGSSTNCHILYDVTIWNVDEKTPVLTFSAKGSASVFLFFYQTALENAVWKSVQNTVGYLRSGKEKF